MATSRKTSKHIDSPAGFNRQDTSFSYQATVFIGLLFSSLLFLSAAFLYLHFDRQASSPVNISLPKVFSVCVVTSMASSFICFRLLEQFRTDNVMMLKYSLAGMTVIALLNGLMITTTCLNFLSEVDSISVEWNKVTAFYMICTIYLMHVAVGVLYLLRYLHITVSSTSDIIQSLLFFTDDIQRTRLRLISIYWHFTNSAWILIYFLFLYSN